MPAYYRASLLDFLRASGSELLGKMTLAHAREGFLEQSGEATLVWAADLARLRGALDEVHRRVSGSGRWTVLLEFVIPRKQRRIDVVLLAGETVVLLEQKSGPPTKEDCLQAEEYALLLHYFHRPSSQRRIVTLVVSPSALGDEAARQGEVALIGTAAFWVDRVRRVRWDDLPNELVQYGLGCVQERAIDAQAWDAGEYFPVPSIIEAARSLQAGLGIREIAHSRAAKHDIDALTLKLQECIDGARASSSFVLCFVTGVPGSGKTLVGLNLAFRGSTEQEALHFMSGNGPLVDVLQAVFAENQARVHGFRAPEARMHAKTLIENVHHFAKAYTEETPDAVPSNHVVIFDEAQRAWDLAQNQRKFRRNYSEPEMLLKIMERHTDWTVVIALVGGGQEINDGEAGLGEWGRAVMQTGKRWKVYASPEATRGGESVAGGRLFTDDERGQVELIEDADLHLKVSVRSLKAENYSRWVNCVVEGDGAGAAALGMQNEFPVFLTRSLAELREGLAGQIRGLSRCGLVGSSKATRLRAEGLEPDSTFHGEYDWSKWYLASATDVRSSSQMEVYASEFEIQGLELDWIGLCWGGDFVWCGTTGSWTMRKFRHGVKSGWSPIRSALQQSFRRNAYRVLMTRARQGLILFVPLGDARDPTRDPGEFEATARFLLNCGVRQLGSLPTAVASDRREAGPERASFFA